MKTNLTRPPAPELPREAVLRRRAHLVEELQRQQRTERPSRRPFYVIVAALVLLGIAAPALGLDDRLRRFVAGEPAPAPVKDVFGRQLPRSVIVERAHGVMSITTARGERVLLWAAPTRLGGRCTFLQIQGNQPSSPDPNGSLACETREGLAQPRTGPFISATWEEVRLRDGTLLRLVFGSLSQRSRIRALELRTQGRPPLVLRLARDFFLAEWPAHTRVGTLIGRDVRGRVVARRQLAPLLEQTATPPAVPALGRVIRARALYGGHEWYMFTATQGEELCVGANLGGPEEKGCNARRPERFTEGPIELYGPGASQDPGNTSGAWDRVWFYGFVAPAVARLVLLSSDCSREVLPIQGHAFLHLARGERLRAGAVPSLLIAYSVSGKEIGRARLQLIPAGRPESEYSRPLPPASCGASKQPAR